MQNLETELCDTQAQLDQIITRLPKEFIPRKEANEKAQNIRKWFAGVIIAGLIVAVSAVTGWVINNRAAQQSLSNCEKTREGVQKIIEVAIPPHHHLREPLMAIEGTKPELCR